MLSFYNTLTRSKQVFKPIRDSEVGIYSCGPTVYNFAHVGNLRAYIFADILKRALLHHGYEVKHILNLTDVGHLTGDRDMGQDKLEQAAAKEHKSAWEIASYYTNEFLNDIKELNILLPNRFPKATDHIKDMIILIQILEGKGYTYQTSDGIYFDASKLQDYGKLAALDIEGLMEGARVEINPEKKNPTDFALWKFSPSPLKKGEGRQMEWESPWGIGFPGWHIECSAMSTKYLGQPFDIHTGGVDHISVHHTNEIAQSEAAFSKPLARFWLHSEHVMINNERMGKSEKNLVTLGEVEGRGFSPLAYRYFVLQGHYRSKLNFTWEALQSAQNTLDNFYSQLAEYPQSGPVDSGFEESFFQAIDDDLDTPRALAVVWELIRSDISPETKLATLNSFDQILGLSLKTTWEELRRPLPEEIKTLVKKREESRLAQNWDEADRLRHQIEKQGYEIRDTLRGPLVKRKI